ncbi:hypothetical protein IFM89_020078 [Coptis chinensis]|uniref:histone acetyltransferase n=1 Tax=Coptis chinensis TaxID=261450 RepID=A0A835HE12_9MAGN|nr:hypothetical protein IFM89_020078 [Coptis chinensis]
MCHTVVNSFALCRCYVDDQNLEERNKHPSSKKAKHNFSKVEAIDVIVDPEYKNEHIYNKIFEDRQTFLRFCQEKYYQHDMLRRAKHSSMMILYYLHNPAEAASEWKNVLENIEKEIQRSPGTCSHH